VLLAAVPAVAQVPVAEPAAAPAVSPAAPPAVAGSALRTLTLAQALAAARTNQPTLRQSRSSTDASRARVDQAASGLYPQASANAGYRLASANEPSFPSRTATDTIFGTGRMYTIPASPDKSFKPYSAFDTGVKVDQLVYDFGQTTGKRNAAGAQVKVQQDNEQTSLLDVVQSVRVGYFEARAAKALLAVAGETLANHAQHMQQIEAFVLAGTRAEIDLAQVRTDRANALVDLIKAENAYASAKARLNQAIGIEQDTDYDVADDSLPPVDGEDGALEPLLQRALKGRSEFVALEHQLRAQELTLGSIRAGYWPRLGVSAGLTDSGSDLTNLAWNWNVGTTVTWQFYQGGITDAQVAEAHANLAGLRAQVDTLRQRVRLEVEQARLAIRAAKAVLDATAEAATSARERLRLANGRYEMGVGNGVELGDAELALANALERRVNADNDQAKARAQLLRALGMQ
jgi:outer membrane protein